jgi:hypothetical protein
MKHKPNVCNSNTEEQNTHLLQLADDTVQRGGVQTRGYFICAPSSAQYMYEGGRISVQCHTSDMSFWLHFCNEVSKDADEVHLCA